MEVEMKIRGLMMDPVTNMPIVVLKDVQGQAILPIWVGVYEANAIALEIEKVQTPRPMTCPARSRHWTPRRRRGRTGPGSCAPAPRRRRDRRRPPGPAGPRRRRRPG